MQQTILEQKIFNISSNKEFEDCALEVFKFQYKNNDLYRTYCEHRGANAETVKSVQEIPFLPISFFKTHKIVSKNQKNYTVFESSGTTNTGNSKHFVANVDLYKRSFVKAFELFYGSAQDYLILALLPSYLERQGSSLIYMFQELISMSKYGESGFFLYNHEELKHVIESNQDKKILLAGVSFALVDFVEKFKISHPNITIMETGGMKGRKKEIVREDLHKLLCKSFNVESIHSEYGMTELLSQAYSKGNGMFETPPWVKILIREVYDPFNFVAAGKVGGINIIDLANIYSCSFIETQDLGRLHSNNIFSIEGRFDASDIRGCNLLVAN